MFYARVGPLHHAHISSVSYPSLEVHALTHPVDGAGDTSPAISPDGSRLVFTRRVGDPSRPRLSRAWVLSFGDEEPRRLTDQESNEWYPMFVGTGEVMVAKAVFARRNPHGGVYARVIRYGIDGTEIERGHHEWGVTSPGSAGGLVYASAVLSSGRTGPRSVQIRRWDSQLFDGEPNWECTTPTFQNEDGSRGWARTRVRQDAHHYRVAPNGEYVAVLLGQGYTYGEVEPSTLVLVPVSGPPPAGARRYRSALCPELTSIADSAVGPLQWSGDGSILTFMKEEDGRRTAWMWSASTGAEQLGEMTDDVVEVSPNHDGSRVVLVTEEESTPEAGDEPANPERRAHILDRAQGTSAAVPWDGYVSQVVWGPRSTGSEGALPEGA
ncbi:MAG: TolB family protein [Polyangiales bacterium]